jgi:hypothetical protein
LALAIKTFINWTTYGTNDITSWMEYAEYVSTRDIFSIYEAIPIYNHPPLMSIWLEFLMWVIGENVGLFPQIFRTAPILADLGSAFLIWRITSIYFSRGDAWRRTLLAVLSPILMMVSGFHGNTDPIFGSLILLAGYVLAVRRRIVVSALVLALAVNVKIVPVLAFPAFFFWIQNKVERIQFALWTGGAALLGYIAHLLTVPHFVFRNVFAYSGLGGIWGFGRLLNNAEFYRGLGIVLFVLAIFFFARQLGQKTEPGTRLREIPVENGLNLFRALALAYLSFLALTSGFGVQYLSWAASLVVFLNWSSALVYTIFASMFLFMVYTHWCGGFPWGYANSWEAEPWTGAIVSMGYLAWAGTLIPVLEIIRALRSAKCCGAP